MNGYDISLFKETNEKLLRESAAPEIIRSSYMELKFLIGDEVSYSDMYDKFGISLSTFNRHIKSLRISLELVFGDDAYIIKTKKEKTYVMVLPAPILRLKLGF